MYLYTRKEYMNLLKALFNDEPKPNDPKVVAEEMMVLIEDHKRWFLEMERIHFVFGIPHQFDSLTKDCLEGEIV